MILKLQHPNSVKLLIYKRKIAPKIGAVNYGGAELAIHELRFMKKIE